MSRTAALALAIAVAACVIGLAAHVAVATEPPQGHKALRKGDPRLKHDHTLHDAIAHVYDVKAEYMHQYLREVRGVENRVALVMLYTAWCGATCDAWVPVLREIALLTREAQVAHRLTILKHDTTRDEVIAQKMGVSEYPTLGLVEAAHHASWKFIKYTGPVNAESVVAFIEQNAPEHAREAHEKLRATFSRSKSV
jgi:hypothetical protein